MKQKFLCTMFVVLMSSGAANAFSVDESVAVETKPAPIGVSKLPGVFDDAPVLMAQSAADNAVRNNQLQEQVRRLNGKVEELTFQLLQLQEQIRKMQEDNEFRFQELEDKRSDAGGAAKKNDTASSQKNGAPRLGKTPPSEDLPSGNSSGGNSGTDAIKETGRILGAAPRSLGTLKFDADGNVIDSAVGKPLDLTSPRDPALNKFNDDGGGVEISNLQPGILLARGRDFYDAGDYRLAERTLRSLVKTYPEGNSRAEAQYWLGRSLFSRGEFHAAATMFLDSHNAYPDAKLAPETLLQLGLSMAGLNHREIACATYAEVLKQYPGANDAVKTQVAIERKSAGC
jgi:tol-pal system protein YbgF